MWGGETQNGSRRNPLSLNQKLGLMKNEKVLKTEGMFKKSSSKTCFLLEPQESKNGRRENNKKKREKMSATEFAVDSRRRETPYRKRKKHQEHKRSILIGHKIIPSSAPRYLRMRAR